MRRAEPVGVLLMAYGTPRSLEEVEAYFTHIRRGRRPSDAELEDLRERYRRIGGTSPLRAITEAQATALQASLDRRSPGRFRVYLAMKHADPFIPDVTRRMLQEGVREIVALVLAPHESRMIVDEYLEYATPVLAQYPEGTLRPVRTWHLNPRYLEALERRVRAALAEAAEPPAVVFTAHSLPERVLEWDDPYPRRLRETCEALAARLGLSRWRLAYQSAGHGAIPWLGPDILEVLPEIRAEGAPAVLVVPIGFVADNLEILYDLDIEAAQHARELGLGFRRTESLNVDEGLIEGLADEVERAAGMGA
ncbi:MAG: ferrochelatase [Armatimonadota bacterium]|nr:ferrochelatase [Armatimonadota bacterium]MDR7439413.1 ferrochelatase [Armatimonadota bacterium]MDR7563054.1 ferrochelatase [Armatimonadota bacterium]MDR7568122.1 ferrochelatase [Armatimonadota bacterium]MDR7602901.1 ferrochelatase [Armatimonadota bacterium]